MTFRALALALFVLTLPAVAQSEYPFDRIFTTPEERRMLDAQRRGEQVDALPGRSVEVAPESDRVTFSGYLLRADGSQIVWVDGESDVNDESASRAGAEHGAIRPGEGSVEFRARDSRRQLKPGQVWLLDRDEVVEGYEAQTDALAPPAVEE
ncbi:MAG: hypothetical protein V2J89_09640 [Halieaceae bacterium]|nr:hypothetical protein [Halieaceae bacterium]